MAITATLGQEEMKRVAGLAYEGKSVRVSLHYNDTNGFTVDSTITDWDTVKLAASNGYADHTVATLPTGGYDATDGRYEIGETAGANTFVEASFTAAGGDIGPFDTVVVQVDGSTYPHSIVVENPVVTLTNGQTQTYRIQLLVDNT